MKLTLLGTGNSAMIPVYGCDCVVCTKAHQDPSFRREKSSAMLEHQGKTLLLDANAPDLMQRFPRGKIDRILLTHYHIDHVHSLFDLRWGMGESIPVISPDDPLGCDDLYKHPGILDFSTRAKAFQSFEWQGILVTPLPLTHSKPCFGYAFEWQGQIIAYITDTVGLPKETEKWLKCRDIEWMIIDCNHPPIQCADARKSANHNDFYHILAIKEACQPKHIGLTHLSHRMVEWAENNPGYFHQSMRLLCDGEEITP
ncbi:phosphonate metabolism protein PhnP [Vibrio sp. 10N.261.55.A7]|uniref:phosphonate metabolism protein PhnP n=1 Tax=Vibrio sp. 10N.261.55.A7 TaxID=1880851 RepID=UPI000C858683|nr:phosphonate metabolism protein PhnP [Vibrio sp. 10N.261.55.A7]PMJ90756.1 phosphonate metabolism protein PhnP [Vibrio sp. 10N.261.55.A7]